MVSKIYLQKVDEKFFKISFNITVKLKYAIILLRYLY